MGRKPGIQGAVCLQDTINVTELRIGDNDTLSAQVAVLVQADWLFLLTDVDFLYTANPTIDPDATPIYVRSVVPGLSPCIPTSSSISPLFSLYRVPVEEVKPGEPAA